MGDVAKVATGVFFGGVAIVVVIVGIEQGAMHFREQRELKEEQARIEQNRFNAETDDITVAIHNIYEQKVARKLCAENPGFRPDCDMSGKLKSMSQRQRIVCERYVGQTEKPSFCWHEDYSDLR